MDKAIEQATHFRTKPSKKFLIFLAVVFVISATMIVVINFIEKDVFIIRILIYIMCGLFAVLSLITFILTLTDYLEVKDNNVTFHFFTSKTKVAISKLNIEYKNGGYHVMYKSKEMHVLDPANKSQLRMYYYLVKHGAKEN